jgi:hypothetical protein
LARIRQLKPSFFTDEDVAELTPWARLLFQGLWTIADKKGRLEERPAYIRIQVFPYDDLEGNKVTLAGMLDELSRERKHSGGAFITRYVVDGRRYIQINAFEKHQRPHPKEPGSEIPAYVPVTEKPRTRREKTRPATTLPGKETEGCPESGVQDLRNLENGIGADAPEAKASIQALALLPPKDTWLTPYSVAWRLRWGSESKPPFGEMARHLRGAEQDLGTDELVKRWERFLAATPTSGMARPLRFIEGLGEWSDSGVAPPARAAPSKPTMNERSMEVVRKLAGGE